MKKVKWLIQLIFLILFVWISINYFDAELIYTTIKDLIKNPLLIIGISVLYLSAFIFRSYAWYLFIGKEASFKKCLDACLYSLFVNHLMPIKIGDVVRIGYVVGEQISWKKAFESVAVMRVLDLLVLGFIGFVGSVIIGIELSLTFAFLLLVGIIALIGLVFIKKNWRHIIINQLNIIHKALYSSSGVYIILLIVASWGFEAFVVYAIGNLFQEGLSFPESVWVNSFTVAGQVFHFAPGGIGTYENFMSFSLSAIGFSATVAYTIAIITHTFKFFFSFIIGLYLMLFAPIPLNKLKQWKVRKKGFQ